MTGTDDVFTTLWHAAGVRLFTITVNDMAAGLVRRIFTSHPSEYPVSGTKPLTLDDDWSRQVLVGKESFIANTTDGFRELFPDHALINALGCHSVMNIPVMDPAGGVIGTVNLLDREDYFTPERAAACERLVAVHAGDLRAALLRQRL